MIEFTDPPAMERLLLAIATHADAEGWAHVGLRQLAAETGMSRQHVDRTARKAEHLGLLARIRPAHWRGDGTRYQLLEPVAVP